MTPAVYITTTIVTPTEDADSFTDHYPVSAFCVFSNEDAAKEYAYEQIKANFCEEDAPLPPLRQVGNNEGWWECVIESFCDVTHVEVRRMLINDTIPAGVR